jgi:hypothetical protein
MKSYSQRNPRWSKQQLGNCKTTLGQSGCKISSLCCIYDGKIKDPKGNLVECHPGILDWVATVNKLYSSGCLISDAVFCKFLGLKFNGRTTNPPKYPCMAETNHYKKNGVPQHFFIWYPDGTILDPLDGNIFNKWTPQRKKNPYHIVSYRLIIK